MCKSFEAGGAVLGFIDFARTEAMQQRAQDAAHMRVVVDDEETQTVEFDTDHRGYADSFLAVQGNRVRVNAGLSIPAPRRQDIQGVGGISSRTAPAECARPGYVP